MPQHLLPDFNNATLMPPASVDVGPVAAGALRLGRVSFEGGCKLGKNRAALTMVGTEGDGKQGVGFRGVNGGARGLGGVGAGYGQGIIYEHLFNLSRGAGFVRM